MKILAFIPLGYSEHGQFWQRDLGIVVLALRELGHDASFITLGATHVDQKNYPLTLVDYQTASDPTWWSAQKADMIILNTWSAPRHQAIRTAALASGSLVVEKLDTDGVKSPRIYPLHSLRRSWVSYDLSSSFHSKMRVWVESLARFLVTYSFPSVLDQKMVRGMEKVPVYVAETPVASARVRRFLRMYHANPMPEVVTIPHPVQSDDMNLPEGIVKENVIISVGRWDDAVKGWPLLRDTARIFLRNNPGWTIKVIGKGAEDAGKALSYDFPERFLMMGRLEHAEMKHHLQSAKIYFLPSHSETFNIAGAEALCCGCSVVGPAQIPSSAFFAGQASGTVGYLRTPNHMADALEAEACEWAGGNRSATLISKVWKTIVGKDAVAKEYLKVFALRAQK
jgi:glycosyltransferase involved in cell wall biosynthesis